MNRKKNLQKMKKGHQDEIKRLQEQIRDLSSKPATKMRTRMIERNKDLIKTYKSHIIVCDEEIQKEKNEYN